MLEIIDKSKCSGCHSCANICPKNCISMEPDDEGFLYPKIATEHCVSCALCEKSCPIISPKQIEKRQNDIIAYATYTKNEEIRLNSSSGGVFTEIASYIINNDGVVFGAAFDDDFSVSHKYVENIDELSIFRGSKYVQSAIKNTYKKAKEFLDNGRMVLFTGTPCQIGGLYSYLNKEYTNLITQDFICHGVPSPSVWQKYLDYQRKKKRSEINNVSFRDKTSGWKRFSMLCDFENGDRYIRVLNKDPYMQSFLSNNCLRPSCYNCSFKGQERKSDITIADFWGIQEIKPEMNDDKGVSLVFVSSAKGHKIFDAISKKLVIETVNIDEAIKYNPSAIKSVKMPQKREVFMKSIKNKGFIKTTNRFFGGNFILMLKKVARKILK